MDHDLCNKCPICDDCHDCNDFSDCSEYVASIQNYGWGYKRRPQKGCLVFLNEKLKTDELQRLKDQFGLNFRPRALPCALNWLLDDAGWETGGRRCYFVEDSSGFVALRFTFPDIPVQYWINESQYRFLVDNHIRYCVLDYLGSPKDLKYTYKIVKVDSAFEGYIAYLKCSAPKEDAKAKAKRLQRRQKADAILKEFKALPQTA